MFSYTSENDLGRATLLGHVTLVCHVISVILTVLLRNGETSIGLWCEIQSKSVVFFSYVKILFYECFYILKAKIDEIGSDIAHLLTYYDPALFCSRIPYHQFHCICIVQTRNSPTIRKPVKGIRPQNESGNINIHLWMVSPVTPSNPKIKIAKSS